MKSPGADVIQLLRGGGLVRKRTVTLICSGRNANFTRVRCSFPSKHIGLPRLFIWPPPTPFLLIGSAWTHGIVGIPRVPPNSLWELRSIPGNYPESDPIKLILIRDGVGTPMKIPRNRYFQISIYKIRTRIDMLIRRHQSCLGIL